MIELRPDKRVQSHFRKTFPRNLMSAVGQGQPPLRELKHCGPSRAQSYGAS
jgi:hypothetical protein